MSGGVSTAVEGFVSRIRPSDDTAHCPVDDWDFLPRYTEGVCPLCGYRPPGMRVSPPLTARIDWFWPTVAVFLVVSIAMGILVLTAYNR